MRIINPIVCACLLVLTSCVSATLSEPSVCDTVTLGSLPNIPVGAVTIPPTTFSTPYLDYSNVVTKVTDIANQVNVAVNQLTLTNTVGDMSWVSSIDVYITGSDPASQPVLIATYAPASNMVSSSLDLSVQIDSAMLMPYLEVPFKLTFTLSGSAPNQPVNIDTTVCVSMSGQFNQSE